jgi:hypothetical protein
MITTITGARAAVLAIEALRAGTWSVSALQDYFTFESEETETGSHVSA